MDLQLNKLLMIFFSILKLDPPDEFLDRLFGHFGVSVIREALISVGSTK